MRLKQHINEETMLDRLVDALFSVINNCQPFLKELGTVNPPQFLYSGRKSNDSWFEKDIRSDRKPTDLFSEIHKSFDDVFNERFGWRARSNGLFCTGYMGDAKEYGTVYTIFPKGPFKIIWSDNIGDLYIKLQDTMGNVKRFNGIKDKFKQELEYESDLNHLNWQPKDIEKMVQQKYDEFIDNTVDRYRGNNIMKAITSNVEIMLNCKSYYAIKWDLYHTELRSFFKLYDNKYNLTKDQIRSIIVNEEY